MRMYGTKKIRGQSVEFFLPLGRELEVILLQVARRGRVPKANYGRAPPISRQRYVKIPSALTSREFLRRIVTEIY